MFRKIVSNLAFSPALVGQLAFYAKRLRKEESTRRLGLIFTALALVVQSFTIFAPPEAANAASPSDFIRGGVKDLNEFVAKYDKNYDNLKDIIEYAGITRDELIAAKKTTINSKQGWLSWGRVSPFSASRGDVTHQYSKTGGGTGIVHSHPLWLWDSLEYTKKYGSTYAAWVGTSKKLGTFAIMKDCANLNTKRLPPPPPKPSPPPPAIPVAVCNSLGIAITNRTSVQFKGAATISGGASVKKYTFTVKDATNTVIRQIQIESTEQSISSEMLTFSKSGKYSVQLTVATSLGEKTDTQNCTESFTIAPPDVCAYNTALPKNSPDCQPCPGNLQIWIKDETCRADVVETKTAMSITKDVDATTISAHSADKIAYTIAVHNTGLQSTTVSMTEQLGDVLEYAKIIDHGGGTFSPATSTLTWTDISLLPGEKQTRVFVIQVLDSIPTTNQGLSNGASYDCIMSNTFGNSIDISVDCPAPKQIEQVVSELPKTGATENILLSSVVFVIATYFYARSRQLKKEVRLIRRDINTGTI